MNTEPLPAVPTRARQALLDYLRLGSGRSLTALHQSYLTQPGAPTRSLNTLRKWSSEFDWSTQAAASDALENQRLQSEQDARREAILQSGLALEHERVEHLTAWFGKLDALTDSEEALWIKQIKTIRLADGHFERVEIRRFNDDLFRLLLLIMDAIALETGTRPRLPRLSQHQQPAHTLQDISLEKLTPQERADLMSLMAKTVS